MVQARFLEGPLALGMAGVFVIIQVLVVVMTLSVDMEELANLGSFKIRRGRLGNEGRRRQWVFV